MEARRLHAGSVERAKAELDLVAVRLGHRGVAWATREQAAELDAVVAGDGPRV